jgi:renalase
MHSRPGSPAHIAVIGAGIAGLSCAILLQDAGLKVRLFEKSGGPSGRMSTRRRDDWQCDHGAQFFTASHPDFLAEVIRWQRAGVAGLWTPRLRILGCGTVNSLDPVIERLVGIPSMTAPGEFLSENLALTTRTTIRQIKREPEGWQLVSVEHGALDERFDTVLLAVPAPQAIPLLRASAPKLADMAGSATMRGCWAIMARFAAPLELPFDAAFVNGSPLRWVARDSSKPGRNGPDTWVLHASAEWSETRLEQDAESVATLLLQAFSQLGAAKPAAWTAHRWRYADTEPPLRNGYCWHADVGLGLCGDWINGGTVEGAWLSGRQLAQQVLHHFMVSQRHLHARADPADKRAPAVD